jgi:UDP-N-acetylmuramate: L-alanyl-gamma-D-glutamyl-meso-diaminopimelate ligase
MSDMLKQWGIPVQTPYSPANLDAAKPDLVVIGNVIRRVNPEATAVRERGLRQMSFPAAMGSLFLKGRHSVVVVGTHGKTTTSSLMGHVLVAAGRDPSFLVGGVTQNYAGNYRVGKGPNVVLEGDEYDTAYFDKGPKFLHYQPRTAIFTSMEFDHADIYRDLAHYASAFEKFVSILPKDGLLAASATHPEVIAIAQKAGCKVVGYSADPDSDADYTAEAMEFSEAGTQFEVWEHGNGLGEVLLPMAGRHNVDNALGVFAASRGLGLSFEEIKKGLESFSGVKRRQEVRGEYGGVLVIDDFAHHPTAVRETLAAIHHRYPTRHIWAVFEPRSNTSRRNIHQEEYARSFPYAERVSLKVPEKHDKVPESEALDVRRLVEDLKGKGLQATAATDVPSMVAEVSSGVKGGDLVLVMSNGAFGGFLPQLIEKLQARFGKAI